MPKRPPKAWQGPFPKKLEPATNRDANTAAATVGIKRETGYRYYKKGAAGLAGKRHNGESKRVRRVNPVSGPMCNPGSFLTIGLQPFERVHSRPPAQARGPTPEGGTLYEHSPVADACRLSPSCVNIRGPEKQRRVPEPDAGLLRTGGRGLPRYGPCESRLTGPARPARGEQA